MFEDRIAALNQQNAAMAVPVGQFDKRTYTVDEIRIFCASAEPVLIIW